MLLPDGKPALDAEKNSIRAEKTFSPNAANGCENLEFTLDAQLFAGKRLVAFERLLQNGKEIAEHTDLTDENQTVEFASQVTPEPKPDSPTAAKQVELSDTGAGNLILPIIFAIAASGSGIALIWLRRNRKE